MLEVLRADAISFSAAISACEKAMQWQQALLVLGDVEHSLLELDIILCNAALSSCAKGSLVDSKAASWKLADSRLGVSRSMDVELAPACQSGGSLGTLGTLAWPGAQLTFRKEHRALAASQITFNAATAAAAASPWQFLGSKDSGTSWEGKSFIEKLRIGDCPLHGAV